MATLRRAKATRSNRVSRRRRLEVDFWAIQELSPNHPGDKSNAQSAQSNNLKLFYDDKAWSDMMIIMGK